jgi:formylglycine-generating enzyme required for sulfatase activity
MALPNPLPDNPLKWDGWKNYNSPNLYARLCLDFSSNANTQIIEDNCRQLLIWWQKKLPLKNQPSNPIAQLLRQGLDEAPQFLAEARTRLLDPAERVEIDKVLHVEVIGKAVEEFKKLFAFILADKTIDEETEAKLYAAGTTLGLTLEDMTPVLDAELERSGILRVKAAPPPPPPTAAPPTPAPAPAAEAPTAPAPATAGESDPATEFRRLLRMSRLCLDGDEMTDDQRDAMCNLGESLGLSGGQAEDLIDEYLEEAASGTISAPAARSPARTAAPPRPAAAPNPDAARAAAAAGTAGFTAPAKPASPVVTPAGPARKTPARVVNLTPAARFAERQKYPNFVNGVGMEMFLIPSGKFEMGSVGSGAQANEQPVTPVTLSCFYMARFPVTNAQYEKFDPAHRSRRAPWADDNHPVVYVSWKEAEDFCRWLSKREGKTCRLPSEAEWEYAARGEDGRIYPWGEKLNAGNLANFADSRSNFVWRDFTINDGYPESSPVGMFPRGSSPFGIEDLAGNVFEWCLDAYEPYKGRELVNPPPARFGPNRVFRGGSWKSRAAILRATARGSNVPTSFSNDVGFRVVRECE